jgi:hypothetical protein
MLKYTRTCRFDVRGKWYYRQQIICGAYNNRNRNCDIITICYFHFDKPYYNIGFRIICGQNEQSWMSPC